ncbi:MAG: HDOD domain-containing protein [Planctomycetota bacterium]
MKAPSALLARQPIFDRGLKVAGYEILFRAESGWLTQMASPDNLTAEVGIHALLDLGLDRIVGNRPVWINIPRNVLVSGIFEFFPPERVVLELLETVEADEEVLRAVRHARSLGFKIALDDFVLNSNTQDLVPLADYVKLDVLASDEAGLRSAAAKLARPGLQLLAEKVETHASFQLATGLGCSLFQGYFFARPQLVECRRVHNNRLALLRVVAELQDEKTSIERIEELIRSDVGLSYRLMRYVNSVGIGTLAPIESLRHAIMTLGMERVRACVLVLMLTAYDDKPDELVTTSLVRARYCQLLCEFHGLDGKRGFLVGLLSAIDAFLDRTIESIVREMGLAEELAVALIRHEGELGLVLEAAIACERADWEGLSRSHYGDAPEDTYLAALSWSAQMQSSLAGP